MQRRVVGAVVSMITYFDATGRGEAGGAAWPAKNTKKASGRQEITG